MPATVPVAFFVKLYCTSKKRFEKLAESIEFENIWSIIGHSSAECLTIRKLTDPSFANKSPQLYLSCPFCSFNFCYHLDSHAHHLFSVSSGETEKDPKKPTCPENWKEYTGFCYRLFDESAVQGKNWLRAELQCMEESGPLHVAHLASINGVEEEKFIRTMFKSKEDKIWIGLTPIGELVFT